DLRRRFLHAGALGPRGPQVVQPVGSAHAGGIPVARNPARRTCAGALSMARIAYPQRDTIPDDLARMLDEMPRHAPIDMLAHSPDVARQFLRLAQAQFTALELPLRD